MPKKPQQRVSIERGETLERIVFAGSRKRMTRRDLHVVLEPIFRSWIRAACSWDSLAIGDYRFLIFEIEVAPETLLYVQFWSEPLEPVVWEVSSGRWNPPADEWLAGERASRIEAQGFAIGGNAENYHRTVDITTPADAAAVAKQVARIFYEGFDYRGAQSITARLVHEGRSEMKATYDALTPEDMAKIFSALGYRVDDEAEGDSDAAPAVLRCRKRGTDTIVEFAEPLEGENLYARVRFEAEVELPEEERQRLKAAPDAPPGAEPIATMSVVHGLGGGVTLDWLIARIGEWDAMLREHRRMARRRRGPRHVPTPAQHTVH